MADLFDTSSRTEDDTDGWGNGGNRNGNYSGTEVLEAAVSVVVGLIETIVWLTIFLVRLVIYPFRKRGRK